VRLLSAALGISVLISSAPAFAGGVLRLVDLTGEFDRFAMATATMPDAQRLTAFEAEVGPMADGFYARERRPNHYDLRILANLRTYPERRAAIQAVSRQFPQLFNHARRSFEAQFGPVTSDQPVFLVDSLGELDGGTRELNGKRTLLFGADVIAEIHSGKDMTAFFHHELFHLYHEPRVTKCAAIWCALWEEGLATYVASRLDPHARDDALGLTVPAPIRPAVETDRPRAICALVRRLESTTDEDFADLFLADARLPGFPSRMGYYIGYLVASDIGRTHGVHEMAEMSLVEARPLIDASLARMATCSPKTAEARERSRTYRTRS
jgi:hypothetical protein